MPTTDPTAYVVFSRAKGIWVLLAWAITLFTGGKVDHCAVVYRDPDFGWMVLTANDNGVTPFTMAGFQGTATILNAYAPIGFSLWTGLRTDIASLNQPYDYLDLFLMAFVVLRRRLLRKFGLTSVVPVEHSWFCSAWVNEIIKDSLPVALASQWPLGGSQYASNMVDPEFLLENVAATPALWAPVALTAIGAA